MCVIAVMKIGDIKYGKIFSAVSYTHLDVYKRQRMQYEFAPLEGITGYIYRNAHHACFPSMDRYYTPFITVSYTHLDVYKRLA